MLTVNFSNRDELCEFLNNKLKLVLERTSNFEEDTSLLQEGLDSLKTIELIVSLEEDLEMEYSDEDLLSDNFSSIRSIIDILIERYELVYYE